MQAFGILSILLAWVAIMFVFLRVSIHPTLTISQHAALNRPTYHVYAVLLNTSVVLLGIFGFDWLIPHYALPGTFVLVFGLGIALEFLATLFPDREGISSRIHYYLAWGAACLIPVLLTLFALAPTLGVPLRILSLAGALFTVGLLGYFFLKKEHAHLLYFQMGYLAAFHVVLLCVTYI